MIPEHLDDRIPLSREDVDRLKPGTITRLRKNGRAHMLRAKKINKERAIENEKLPEDLRRPLIVIEDFDPIDVYEAKNWICQSPGCFRRVDVTKAGRHPESCVAGHWPNLAHNGNHTREGFGPWHYSCNVEAAAKLETPREAKINRLRASHRGIDENGDIIPEKEKTLTGTREIKKNPPSRWPSRKIQSRNNLRRRK